MNYELIKAFLQNAKEKESCLVYGNSSIRDLKGSGNNEDKILNYLKKDIDISSNKTGHSFKNQRYYSQLPK